MQSSWCWNQHHELKSPLSPCPAGHRVPLSSGMVRRGQSCLSPLLWHRLPELCSTGSQSSGSQLSPTSGPREHPFLPSVEPPSVLKRLGKKYPRLRVVWLCALSPESFYVPLPLAFEEFRKGLFVPRAMVFVVLVSDCHIARHVKNTERGPETCVTWGDNIRPQSRATETAADHCRRETEERATGNKYIP